MMRNRASHLSWLHVHIRINTTTTGTPAATNLRCTARRASLRYPETPRGSTGAAGCKSKRVHDDDDETRMTGEGENEEQSTS